MIELEYDKNIANKNREIGQFDILKDLLNNFKDRTRFNFQRIFDDGGIVWSFKNFFSIDLTKTYKMELDSLNDYFKKKRHAIIHGKLEDKEFKKEDVENMIDLISKIISFLKDNINQLKLNPNVILQFGAYDKTRDYT